VLEHDIVLRPDSQPSSLTVTMLGQAAKCSRGPAITEQSILGCDGFENVEVQEGTYGVREGASILSVDHPGERPTINHTRRELKAPAAVDRNQTRITGEKTIFSQIVESGWNSPL